VATVTVRRWCGGGGSRLDVVRAACAPPRGSRDGATNVRGSARV